MRNLLLSIIVIIISAASFLSADIRRVNKTAALKELYIGISLNEAISILEKYRVRIGKREILREETETNPYHILKTNIFDIYKPLIRDNAIVINTEVEIFNFELNKYSKKEENYYIDLLDTTIDTPLFFFFNKDRRYFIQYKKINEISVIDQNIGHINPHLINAKLYFYDNILYKIDYKASFNLDEIERFITNYKERFRVDNIGNGENVFYQAPYFYKLTFPNNIKNLLDRINFHRSDERMFKNHPVSVEMYNSRIADNMRLYKAKCYDIFVRDISRITAQKIEKTKKAIYAKQRENRVLRNHGNVEKRRSVDEL